MFNQYVHYNGLVQHFCCRFSYMVWDSIECHGVWLCQVCSVDSYSPGLPGTARLLRPWSMVMMFSNHTQKSSSASCLLSKHAHSATLGNGSPLALRWRPGSFFLRFSYGVLQMPLFFRIWQVLPLLLKSKLGNHQAIRRSLQGSPDSPDGARQDIDPEQYIYIYIYICCYK